MKSKQLYWVVSLGGVGSIPKSPGTFGTLATIPIWYALQFFHPYTYMIATVLLILLAVYVCGLYEAEKGSHDRQEIVLDEVVGFLVAMTWIPADWKWILLGVVIFRILDIWKPGPIGYIDTKMKGGAGVVLDDVAAGILTNIFLHLLLETFPGA